MPLLFELPILVLPLLVAGVLWLMWVIRVEWWFGRQAWWTVVVWPVPGATLLLPFAVAPVWALLRFAGLSGREGSLLEISTYLVASLVPWTLIVVWPPRLLLPGWARMRLTALPDQRTLQPAGAVPALHVVGERGHGSRARWAWRVDAVAGGLTLDGTVLRFRSLGDDTADGAPVRTWLDDALDDDMPTSMSAGAAAGDVPRLQSPRGGWWTRRKVDLDLPEVNQVAFAARRPWRRDGLVVLEVSGREPLRLWVADVRQIRRWVDGISSDVMV